MTENGAMVLSPKMTPDAGRMSVTTRGVRLGSLEELVQFARLAVATQFVPKSFKGVNEVVVALQWGMEIGMTPMQSLQSIAVINNRPSVWGDAALALVRRSPLCEYVKEWQEGTGDKLVAFCEAKRRTDPEAVKVPFSWDDAKRAGLAEKMTYKQYPRRMCQLRARGFALRDAFADLLCGLVLAEEAQDYQPEPSDGATLIFDPANPDAKVGRSALNDELDGKTEDEPAVEVESAEPIPAKDDFMTHPEIPW